VNDILKGEKLLEAIFICWFSLWFT